MQAIKGVPDSHVVGAPRPDPRASASGTMDPMVLRALSVFERNVAMYVQRPDRVRELQAGLTAAQSEALMAALVDCFPLAVLHQGLDRQKSGDAPLDIAAHILSPQSAQASESFNEARVAELFRRVLGDFEGFKQTPHAYEGWLAGCTRRERKMLESLVSAFWDWPYVAGAICHCFSLFFTVFSSFFIVVLRFHCVSLIFTVLFTDFHCFSGAMPPMPPAST